MCPIGVRVVCVYVCACVSPSACVTRCVRACICGCLRCAAAYLSFCALGDRARLRVAA